MLAWLIRAAIDVNTANAVGTLLAGHPDQYAAIACISWRESRNTLVSVHAVDSWMQRRLGPGMSTRGVHGQVAAYALPSWLHWAPWLLDVPLASAVVATRRAKHWRCRQVQGCVRWRRCER